jgi:selenide,water dikinase
LPYDLILLGGGHSHAIALQLFGLNPILDVRLTLISDVEQTPYSGMLPGHVAGFYTWEQTHIDLRQLSQFAPANLLIDKAVGLDLDQNRVICQHSSPLSFDYLSIDIGSTPDTISVPGAKEYATPAKPVPQFLDAWEKLLTAASNNPEKPMAIAVVGGGAGGVELALNMHSHLQTILKNARQPLDNLRIHLFHRGERLLSSHNHWVSQRLESILRERGIKLHLQQTVKEVLPDKISCESGLTVECNYIFWVTQAAAPSWIKASGLATDAKGFILVKDTLQSVSHPHVFAAGDIATMQNYHLPKAGVFAVRQGKPLLENWRRLITGQSLKPYVPQKRYLSLIGTGDKSAIASWGCLGWQSPLLWYWKDYIDRQFMNRFSNLRGRAGGEGF